MYNNNLIFSDPQMILPDQRLTISCKVSYLVSYFSLVSYLVRFLGSDNLQEKLWSGLDISVTVGVKAGLG